MRARTVADGADSEVVPAIHGAVDYVEQPALLLVSARSPPAGESEHFARRERLRACTPPLVRGAPLGLVRGLGRTRARGAGARLDCGGDRADKVEYLRIVGRKRGRRLHSTREWQALANRTSSTRGDGL